MAETLAQLLLFSIKYILYENCGHSFQCLLTKSFVFWLSHDKITSRRGPRHVFLILFGRTPLSTRSALEVRRKSDMLLSVIEGLVVLPQLAALWVNSMIYTAAAISVWFLLF